MKKVINPHLFDRDLEMQPVEQHVFSVRITDNWSINYAPNGGYVMAVLAKAMLQCSDKQGTPIITANYISRCQAADALIYVDLLSTSRNFTRLQARLVQDGEERVRAWGTFASDPESGLFESYEADPPEMEAFERCIQVPKMPDLTLFDHIDLRFDPAAMDWALGKQTPSEQARSEHKGWVQFMNPRNIDIPAIVLFADAFPPCVFATRGMNTWVPTIEFSVNIRKVSASCRLKGVFRTRFISSGLVEEDGELWDETGTLVALSRQIAKYRQTK
ncbi:MAG: thioesterase family protein [Desulfobacteraceae bacterium]|mgnify:FL=1|nr:MAG: thioesterase family protein [Desulfobacteraceae bacterium]